MANAIAVVASIIALGIVVYHLNQLIFYHRGAHDEVHLLETEDGWPLALYRFFPESPDRSKLPVIMCHGLTANHGYYDPGGVPGLAPYLRDHGFEVWTLDLRGVGMSGRLYQKRNGKRPARWKFEDYARYDVPAIIKYVCNETGSKQVNWVGHSMGGMMMYDFLETQDVSPLRSVTAFASPAILKHYKWHSNLAPLIIWYTKTFKYMHFKEFTHIFGPLAYLLPTELVGAPRNMYPWLAINAVSNHSQEVLATFIKWAANDTSSNPDRISYYKDDLEKITTPFLSIVGAADWVALPPDVRYGIEKMSSVDKKYVYFSRRTGAKANYDHVSITFAKDDAFPVLLDWLEKHSAS